MWIFQFWKWGKRAEYDFAALAALTQTPLTKAIPCSRSQSCWFFKLLKNSKGLKTFRRKWDVIIGRPSNVTALLSARGITATALKQCCSQRSRSCSRGHLIPFDAFIPIYYVWKSQTCSLLILTPQCTYWMCLTIFLRTLRENGALDWTGWKKLGPQFIKWPTVSLLTRLLRWSWPSMCE